MHCRHSWHRGLIISSLLRPRLLCHVCLRIVLFPFTQRVRKVNPNIDGLLSYFPRPISFMLLESNFPFSLSAVCVCVLDKPHPQTQHISPDLIDFFFVACLATRQPDGRVGRLDDTCTALAICMSCTRISECL